MEEFGISAALLTPFAKNGDIDWPLLCRHANELLENGVNSITLFGTTGEGASISLSERRQGVEELINAACPATKIILGICATSTGDAARQIDDAFELGVRDFLLLPPFYFKQCTDTGLYDWHCELFSLTDRQARFILYHIPQVSGVALSVDLVNRLADHAGDRLYAIKDSSGSWENTKALLTTSVPVLVGDERQLHRGIANGAVGAISGMANLYPDRMNRIVQTANADLALSEEVTRIVSMPVIPALKATLAARISEPTWERMRPPLTPLDVNDRQFILGAGKAAV